MSSILSLNQLLDHAAASVPDVVEADTVSILLIDPSNERLEIVASSGIREEVVASFSLARDEGVAGRAIADGRPVLVNDTSEDPLFRQRPGTTRPPARLVAVPLVFKETALGALCVERARERPPFDEEEVKLLSIVGAQVSTCIRNSRLFAAMEERIDHLSTAQEIGNLLVSTLDLEHVLQLVIDGIVRVTGADVCSIMLLDEERKELSVQAALGLPDEFRRGARVKVGDGISGWVVARGEPLLIRDIERDPAFSSRGRGRYPSRSLLSVPLLFKDRVLGVININSTEPDRVWTKSDENLLSHFAGQAAIAIENARLYEQLERMATTDPVTGIRNHRSFQEALTNELARAARYGQVFSLLLLDVDHFKLVNDHLGHQKGDAVLRGLGTLLHRTLRSMDTVARYGGEEFAVILPQTVKVDGLRSGERLRRAVADAALGVTPGTRGVTISIGVATFPEDGETKDQLICAADAALYRAKAEGRDRVCVA